MEDHHPTQQQVVVDGSSNTSTTTALRKSCQHCRKRKIKCISDPQDSACKACIAKDQPCIYAPQSLMGRPPKSKSGTAPAAPPSSGPSAQPSGIADTSSKKRNQSSTTSSLMPGKKVKVMDQGQATSQYPFGTTASNGYNFGGLATAVPSSSSSKIILLPLPTTLPTSLNPFLYKTTLPPFLPYFPLNYPDLPLSPPLSPPLHTPKSQKHYGFKQKQTLFPHSEKTPSSHWHPLFTKYSRHLPPIPPLLQRQS
ncbi:hypothetical protein P389DRAFT_114552 [Cystobasidium minutum MCA 4210]|uniref:uncharacterized protein n=1 Tax=Cystobasidium minutum MCA 4210 TaxID=1397322 RepID=UPI0034CD81F9|eukprot:jgi/Rhomi1/114552/CE114551_419